jgi:chorismate dehydratase
LNRNIKVTAVSYLNTKPLLYGIERHPVLSRIDLNVAYPSQIAAQLQNDTTDIGLVSTAAILTIPDARIVTDYCIAADGPVASVCIYSHCPLEEVEQIYMDYQSRTSVKLAEILLKHHWKKDVVILPAPEDFIDHVKGTTAAVIIGDRALKANHHFPYIYDLAAHWKAFTGYDFVFAAWIANKALPEDFIREFSEANALGLQHIDEVIAANPFPEYSLDTYYRQNIRYQLDDNKRKGLELFLQYLKEMP